MSKRTDTDQGRVTRRDFLRLSAVGAIGVAAGPLMSACAVIKREPVTVKLMSFWWAESGRDEVLRLAVKEFHEAQNDIRIEEVSFPYATYWDNLSTQLAAGAVDADIIHGLDAFTPKMMSQGFLEPMQDVAEKAGVMELGPVTTMPPWYWDDAGNLYAVGMNYAKDGLIYNTEIFEKAGVTEMPTTQDEAYELAKELTNRPDQFGYALRHTLPEKSGFFRDMTVWLMGYDGTWAEGKTPTLDTEAVVNTFANHKRFYEDAFPQGATASDYRQMLADGKVAMNTDNNALPPVFFGLNPDAEKYINSAPLPWPNRKGAAFMSYSTIYSGSEKKDAAKAFLEWFFDPENFVNFNQRSKDPPLIPQADTEEYRKSLPWMTGFFTTDGVPFPVPLGDYRDNQPEVQDIVARHASEMVVGAISPEDAARQAQKEMDELADTLFG